jgi:hypothetical protein
MTIFSGTAPSGDIGAVFGELLPSVFAPVAATLFPRRLTILSKHEDPGGCGKFKSSY